MVLKKQLDKKKFEELVSECQIVIFRNGNIAELVDRVKSKRYKVNVLDSGLVDVEEVDYL